MPRWYAVVVLAPLCLGACSASTLQQITDTMEKLNTSLEAGKDPAPAQPAAPRDGPPGTAPTQPARGEPAPARPGPVAPRAGYVRGRAIDASGRPVAGAEVVIRGATTRGFAQVRTDADGLYEAKVPDTQWVVYAWKETDYAGEHYLLGLDPAEGDWRSGDSHDGLVRNFVWKIAGRVPRPVDVRQQGAYYGGAVLLSALLPKSVKPDPDAFELNFPAGSVVEVTLTPAGARIDGSKGTALSFRRTYEGGIRYGRGSAGEEEFLDVPIGSYSITAKITEPGGRSYAGRVGVERLGETLHALGPSAALTVPPRTGVTHPSPYQGSGVEGVTLYVVR